MLLLPQRLRLSRRDKKVNGLTYSQKKYIFAIYKLGQNGGEVKSAEVATFVGVSKASTVSMAAKLCESGYITKEHYGQIALTEIGIKAANSIFTNYIIIRDFLENALGPDEATADSDQEYRRISRSFGADELVRFDDENICNPNLLFGRNTRAKPQGGLCILFLSVISICAVLAEIMLV